AVGLEGKAGLAILDGIAEPAGGPDDGQAAIAEGMELRQPAGLVKRGHQEGIASAVDAASERFVEAETKGKAPRPAPHRTTQLLLQGGIAAAEDGELQVASQKRIEGRQEEVQALLPGDAGDHAHEKGVGRLQAELLLQRPLARRLAAAIVGGKMRRQVGIGRGVPGLDVDAVENADEAVAERAQLLAEAERKLGVADLAGVGRRDGGHEVGGADSAPQQGELSPVGPGSGDEAVAEEVAGLLQRKMALVAQVVDGEDRARSLGPAEQGPRRGLPVVEMEDLRRKAQGLGRPKEAAREEGETG